MKKFLLTTCAVLFLSATNAQIVVNVPTEGGFGLALKTAGGDKDTITILTVTGNIDARDIKFLRDSMPVLAVLDLEEAHFIEYYGKEGTYKGPYTEPSYYAANAMPANSFCTYDSVYNSKKTLTSIKFPNDLTYIGEYAFAECNGLKGSLIIPNSVTYIRAEAFKNCIGLTGSLNIPGSVTEIEANAFSGCTGFTGSLTIPNSVTSVGVEAFSGCSGLKGTLTISNQLTSIEFGTFLDCGFTGTLTIPNSVSHIGWSAFLYCSGFTGNLTIPNTVTIIDNMAFSGCSGFTGNLTIPNSVTKIGKGAFGDCVGLNGTLTLPNTITAIEDYTFIDCFGLNGLLTIPKSVTTIGTYAFSGCYGFADNLTIPKSVSYIGYEAFAGCSGFSDTLKIPDSVDTIGDYAFAWCSSLQNIIVSRKVPLSIGSHTFEDVTNTPCALLVPIGSKTAYQTATVWKEFFKFIEWGFKITFNTKEGSAIKDTFVNENTNITIPTIPSKAGYTFVGWYKEYACSNPWLFETDLVSSDTTLYAKWSNLTNSITMNKFKVNIFPNPTHNYLNIEGNNLSSITIYNVLGNIVLQEKYNDLNKLLINVTDLKLELYILKVQLSNGEFGVFRVLKN